MSPFRKIEPLSDFVIEVKNRDNAVSATAIAQ
jgi:hypothetical protein